MRVIRGAAVSALVVGMAAGLVALGGPAAAEGSPDCVTKHEWHRAERGMTITRVHRIFDTNGRLNRKFEDGPSDALFLYRFYRACSGSSLEVGYKRQRPSDPWRVAQKYGGFA